MLVLKIASVLAYLPWAGLGRQMQSPPEPLSGTLCASGLEALQPLCSERIAPSIRKVYSVTSPGNAIYLSSLARAALEFSGQDGHTQEIWCNLCAFIPAAAGIPSRSGLRLFKGRITENSDLRCKLLGCIPQARISCSNRPIDRLPRRTIFCTATAALLTFQPCLSWARAEEVPKPAIVPLSICGGAYCTTYSIDGQFFRAVVDTGSPFVLVVGTCEASDISKSQKSALEKRWGCYRGAGQPSGLGDTIETFGGEDVGVEWRRGNIALTQVKIDEQFRLTAAIQNAVFGVVRSYEGKGGGGAPFLGLCKRRLPRIRPTFLEKTNIAALRFDFVKRRLELSCYSLIPRSQDAVRLLDLRIAGAPVSNYAVKVSRLFVNGARVKLDQPLLAIIDTGTTGISVSDELFDSGALPQQWREARIEMQTERGGICALEAAIKNRRKRLETGLPLGSPEFDEFPLVVSPVHVPWFDPGIVEDDCGDGQPYQCNGKPVGQRRSLADMLRLRALGLDPAPHVLFVGLAFLWSRQLTIDADAGRLLIV